jgi:tetratricopeptide (TPR) repeat protein
MAQSMPASSPAVASSGPAPRGSSQPASAEAASGPVMYQAQGAMEFPLAKAMPLRPRRMSLGQLKAMFPDFQHKPFETSGFNVFTMPLRFVSMDGSGSREEALAFSFLLSSSLDWAEGAYCARHAYFIFKRSPRFIQPMTREYDPSLVTIAIKDWQATHAVGGVLMRSREGFAGTLEIFDCTGTKVLRKEYNEPRDFFTLLGDMCVDGMIFFGTTPNEAMVKHLHRKRCEHEESIVDLGKAAFAKEKSDQEFGLYRQILDRDPNFADVRFWWANQRYWTDHNRGEYIRQIGLALEGYPIPEIMEFYKDKEKCPDPQLVAHLDRWLGQVKEITGKDPSQTLSQRIEDMGKEQRMTGELLEQAQVEAAENPNRYLMLRDLARAYRSFWGNICDEDMAASLCLAAIENRFLTGTGNKDDAWYNLTRCLIDLGHPDMAEPILAMGAMNKEHDDWDRVAHWYVLDRARVLVSMGYHKQAIGYYRLAYHHWPDKEGKGEILVEAAIAAAVAGETTAFKQIMRDRHDEIKMTKMLPLLEAYEGLLDGRPVQIAGLWKKNERTDFWSSRLYLDYEIQLDLISGRHKGRTNLTKYLRTLPNDRPLWILYDAYDRHQTRVESASFYLALEWLHGDDPWVRKAVADYRSRCTQMQLARPDDLLAKLKDYPPVRWPARDPNARDTAVKVVNSIQPGAVECAIHALMQSGDYAKAEELALRFHHLAVQRNYYNLCAQANHLIHLVQRAKAAAACSQPASNR